MESTVELIENIPELEVWRERLAGLGIAAIALVTGSTGTTTAGIHLTWGDHRARFGWVLAERPSQAEARQAAVVLLAGFAMAQDHVAADYPPVVDRSKAERVRAIAELEQAFAPFGGPPTYDAPAEADVGEQPEPNESTESTQTTASTDAPGSPAGAPAPAAAEAPAEAEPERTSVIQAADRFTDSPSASGTRPDADDSDA